MMNLLIVVKSADPGNTDSVFCRLRIITITICEKNKNIIASQCNEYKGCTRVEINLSNTKLINLIWVHRIFYCETALTEQMYFIDLFEIVNCILYINLYIP